MGAGPLTVELIVILILTILLLHKYGNWQKQHPIVTGSTLITWFFSFVIVCILPLDVSLIDPIYHKELVGWREAQNPIDRQHPFLQRIYNEEISPCLNFQNAELAEHILVAVEANSLYIEQIIDDKTIARLKVETDGEWHYISQLCRNRIAAVYDFFTYIRYLSQGLIKAGVHDAYWELIRLRKNMALARLGLGFCSSYQKI